MDEDVIHDAKGTPIEEGHRVRVLALTKGLADGLPPENVAFLDRAVGMTGEVDEITAGFVSVLLVEASDHFHFVTFRGPMLEVVP